MKGFLGLTILTVGGIMLDFGDKGWFSLLGFAVGLGYILVFPRAFR